MKKIMLFVLGMGIAFFIFMLEFFSVMATSPVPSPNFSYTPTHIPKPVPGSSDDVSLPVPIGNCSPALTSTESSNITTIVESSEFQEVVIDIFEEGATYGISQKGYTVNSSVYQVSPEATATVVMYSGYQALNALYGNDADYQYFIQPYKDMDNGGIFGGVWGQIFPVNTIYGTFTYGEMRLDALIDEKTGEIKASVLSFQNGFERTVDRFISKVQNNFYCPVKPEFECDEYGLTQLTNSMVYSYTLTSSRFTIAVSWVDDKNVYSMPVHFCCFLKEYNYSTSKYKRDLLVVTTEPLPEEFDCYSFGTGSSAKEAVEFSKNIKSVSSQSGKARLAKRKGEYYFYVVGSIYHQTSKEAGVISDYYYPYLTFNMKINEFADYYIDNAGELSVGGVLLSPVQPSVKGFPQPGNVYNPSDMQEYNNNQREKIEECPVILPQSEPYPGSVPAPAVEPLPGTHALPLIITDPATGEMTVKPVELPDPAPGGDKVIDPDTGEEVTNKNLSPYMFDLSKKFPFCVPFDLIECVKILKQKPAAPSFEWTLKVDMINFEYTFHIDLACFEPAAKICRIMFTLLFIVSLVVVTRNMIRG